MKKIRIWLQAIRPFAFTASVIPVTAGACVALILKISVAWAFFPLVLLCAMLFHAGTNVVSEYFDYKKGVDQKHTLGSSRVLVDRLADPKTVLRLGYILFAVGFLLGLILVSARGIPMFVLGVAGLCGGLFYTGSPIGYKYRGLGDIMVFILMGPLMVIGSFFAMTGCYRQEALYLSLPIGFLVTAILSSNNLRDIRNDLQAGVRTLENRIGHQAAGRMTVALIGAAYFCVVLLFFSGTVSGWIFLTFLSIPLAVRNARIILKSSSDDPPALSAIDMFSAQLHMAFGVLLILSLLIQAMIL